MSGHVWSLELRPLTILAGSGMCGTGELGEITITRMTIMVPIMVPAAGSNDWSGMWGRQP